MGEYIGKKQESLKNSNNENNFASQESDKFLPIYKLKNSED
jgi:hypothetical protein